MQAKLDSAPDPSRYNDKREKPMSSQFDGMRIYEYMRATQTKYEIRGNYIHENMRATQPVF